MKTLPAAPLRRRLFRALETRGDPLRIVVEESRRRDVRVFLVGGPVRDLLLGLPVQDVDVLLSDRLEQIAEACARRLSTRVRHHSRFLTATLQGAEFRIDLSRARTEVYRKPGVLPRVQPAELEEDFARRDFSVNAMALPLDEHSGDVLVDLHAGLEDLEARRLRVLHSASFTDDPTRLYRAARYAARLRFRLDRKTAALARSAVRHDSVATLSAARVLHEFERLLDEGASARALAQTQRLGLLEAAVQGWDLAAAGGRALRRLDRAKVRAPWSEAAADREIRACGLRLLQSGLRKRLRSRVLERLGIAGSAAQRIERDLAAHPRLLRALAGAHSPGQLDATLSGSTEPALLMLFCSAPSASQRCVVRYARSLRHVRGPFDGHRVRALGARGPLVGKLLRVARRRALDGRAVDDVWARRWLARQRQIG